MSVSPTQPFSPSTEPQAEQGNAREAQGQSFPPSGNGSTEESERSQNVSLVGADPQDEVKVQMEPPGEIPVYQFVNQQGTLILQVPPKQVLDLALQISQELAQAAALKDPAPEKGKKHGS